MLRPNNTPAPHRQDDLADLARQIRDHHRQIQRTLGLTLGQMLDTGDLLIAAQGLVQSNWKKWLRTECFLGVSTAQLYQQLARHRHAIEGELSRFRDLTLRAARRLIAAKTSKPTKATTETSTAAPAPTLLELWGAASNDARRAFLEQVGVPGLLAVLSDSMKSDLAQRCFGAAASSSALSEKEKRKLKTIGRKVSTQRLREIPPEGNA